ncbi:hypothetical protein GCM10009677_04210 [Sphaerisporangium rubeum]|uniref:Nitroreductase family deazaflavin-dependent oxidoreductase n=1 Tax=Sphaerisporangium rubeum TaxID=321317 RepID=A0A7X0M5E1_9ACTN|nr:hypothetical protein [Sphaerisporangium rubeum]MBB6470736.1 hypothetical protein [Sphaerisporangium rubeum]
MGPMDRRGRVWEALRAPVWLYRLGLGWTLGRRVLYLVTRRAGTETAAESTLKVVHLDRAEGTVYVVGDGSDWYRDLQAGPAVEIRLGRRRLPRPAHRFLTPEECRSMLVRHGGRHRWTWREAGRLRGPSGAARPRGVRAVAFRPDHS